MTLTDQSTQARPGEELDAGVIDSYLKANIAGLDGQPSISQFPGGASNLTYLVSYPVATWCCAARRSARRPSPPTTWAASSVSSTN